jgi:hypothetical protein
MNALTRALTLLCVAFLFAGCPKNGETRPEPVHPSDHREADPPPATISGAVPVDSSKTGPQAAGIGRAAVEACVDRWLEARELDMFGHPEGTMYAGGTPLFNEATGESRDRLEYVFGRHPEARKACAAPGAQ